MKPLLTPPGLDAAPIETATARPAARPPASVLTLQLLLLAATAALIATWQWAWHGVQAYAWPGLDLGLDERGLAYLLILAPAVPVNLLAAIWLGRGGRRAQLYLAAAGTLAFIQATLLLTPAAMPLTGGGNAVGVRFLTTVGPIVFAGAWLAAGRRARAWLGAAPRPRRRLAGIEAAVWCLALAAAFAMGTEVRQWTEAATEPTAPRGQYTEAGTWARLEQTVAETTGAVPSFPGFTARTLDVADCGYRTPAGLPTYRYLLTYELREPREGDIAALWDEGDYRLTYNGATLDGTRRITAERTYPVEEGVHTVTVAYTGGESPSIYAESPCVERTGTPECLPPQGEPLTDTVNGITCPRPD